MNPLTEDRTDAFIHFLYSQQGAEGRANLAELRRAAANQPHDLRDIRILGNHLPDTNDWAFEAHRLVGTLFALYATKFWTKSNQLDLPRFDTNNKRRSLGASLRLLRGQLGNGQDSLDLRFSALLDTTRDDLAIPLRGMVQRIATADKRIPIDFHRLLRDLLYWNVDHPTRLGVARPGTRQTWARDYWQATDADSTDSLPSNAIV